MNKMEQIQADMIAAMKAGQKQRKDQISFLYGALKNAQIDKRSSLTDEEIDAVIMKQLKMAQETLSLTPPDRLELMEEAKSNLALLQEYAPKMLSEEEITGEIRAVLAELDITAPSAKDKGRIMKALMGRVKGRADGQLVNRLLSALLQ